MDESALYRALGLSVGVIVHDLDDEQRRAAYGADITYGTNNEFGFDYLRDNMKYDLANCVQRGHHFAIVDEVDSILIDEARTPLIISGPSEESTDKYAKIDKIIPKLIQDIDLHHRRKTSHRHAHRRGLQPSANACSASPTCPTRRTSTSCITCTRPCAPTRCIRTTSIT